MKKLLQITLLLILSGFLYTASAENKEEANNNKNEFKNKVSELYTKHKLDGFITYKGGDINMQKNTEFPIWVDLQAGRWYHFCVVGDPQATKLEMKLSRADRGNIVTDKFRTDNTNEHWTEFSFVCNQSGRYLLTFYQRGHKKDLLGHVAILQRPAKTADGSALSYTLK